MADPCPPSSLESLEARNAELTAALTAPPLSDQGRVALLISVREFLRLHGHASAADVLEEF